MPTPFETYIASIEKDLKGGKATEHTYRSALEALMEAQARGIAASNDPKHIECGAPDFIVEKGRVPLGYVETKDVGADLNKIEKSDQMKRYLKALNNLILTDYLEFRWYVNGEKKLTVKAADVGAGAKRLALHPQAEENIGNLFRDFYATETPTVATPKDLASRLAGVTHFIRDRITEALNTGDESVQKALQARYNTFRELLLPALKPEEFADLYAQAMTYGLFAAKLSATPSPKSDWGSSDLGEGRVGVFTLQSAYQYLFGNKFLRRLFSDVSEELDEIEIIRPYLQDIVSLLNRANFASILADFGRRTRTEDPVVHFYETFLAAYDPKLRESRGVYYTPEPVVQFIVRSVDELLKTRFGKAWGLADSSVKVLDPATGTGTFLYYVIQQIHDEVTMKRKQAGQWGAKSKELLNRLFGFELLIAPYVVSHLKLGLLLQTLGSPLAGKEDRLRVFLTNTLEEGVTRAEQLQGLGHYIAEEASDAAHVKKQQDIMVVLGNPPYSGHSANKGEWIDKLLREYYFVDGAPLGERNPKWLQDDYVKFIRFGEWRIDQTGHGVLAFITNHGYLDNPTFRGMRQHLMNTFDEIYVLDLHGNSKKKEKTPDGGKDENVFDIQQGVAILLAIKTQDPKGLKRPLGSVRHAHLWGLRKEKYAALQSASLNEIEWTEIQPDKPFYLLVPQDTNLRAEYEQGWKITNAITENLLGFQTHRDEVAVSWREDTLQKQVVEYLQAKPTRDDWQRFASLCTYRPFDSRFAYLAPNVSDRSRFEIMKHLFKPNLALAIGKQGLAVGSDDWNICFCSSLPVDANIYRRGGANIFPLYLYTTPEETAGTLFAQSETTRKANLSPEFIAAMEEKLKLTFDLNSSFSLHPSSFSPEDVFYYAYAVFHNPTYRKRYAEFLKIDFPRLPLTGDKKLFAKLVGLGKELVELHLLKSPKVEEFITAFPVAGDNKVEKVVFGRPDKSHKESDKQNASAEENPRKQAARGDLSGLGRVWINPTQYFDGVPENVWEFQVGGYQVCEKWLKDRKERTLSGDDVNHYQRVVVSLKETIRLMKEIDKAVVKWPM
ncbi:MAG: DNA methyltransferase [Chloroflexi bacterium CFX1]|nr:MAG: DNA methyltransferase [Chloroflexota bacterium]MCE7919728.1 DNA methyltransferase [Chloroflexi bacterium CFX1]MCQ3954734.1 DNA methyltransferase [Chloroflexota bacterium]